MMTKVVTNASPWIALAMIDEVPLMMQLFHSVVVPQAVIEEVMAPPPRNGQILLSQALDAGTVIRYQVRNPALVDSLLGTLHRGELEAIVAAQELNADYVLLDDRMGRRFAHTLLLSTMGTMGILRTAKERGLIPEIKTRLVRLINGNFRVSPVLYEEILREVGESP
ncbi:MAG: DUF3368 domain-containing protein [Firmicutes bacterium]|nr:DUF3368 domain-containing protein [Bacillota bacterium]